MQTTQLDPIIAEIRAIRDEYAAHFNYDVAKMFQDIRARQEASDREYVCYPAHSASTDLNIHSDQGANERHSQDKGPKGSGVSVQE